MNNFLTNQTINMANMISNLRILMPSIKSIRTTSLSRNNTIAKEMKVIKMISIRQAPIRLRSLDRKTRSRNSSKLLLQLCLPELFLWTLNQMSLNLFRKLNQLMKPNRFNLRLIQVLKNSSQLKKHKSPRTKSKKSNLIRMQNLLQ